MLSINQLQGLKVYLPPEERKRLKRDGSERKPKRIGKVHSVVFSPNGRKVVGLMVKRPDIAGMVKRDDLFLGLDAFEASDQTLHVTMGDDSFDDAARERLKVRDWDSCIIWGGMDVKTSDGHELGHVTDITFNSKTGAVKDVCVSDGSMSTALVGVVPIPVKLVVGYQDGWMLVKPEAADLKLSGGLAEKAGTATAKMKVEGKKAGEKAGKATAEAVDKGSYQLGRALGKAKRAIKEAQAEDEPQLPPVKAADVVVAKKQGEPAALIADSETNVKKRTYAPKKGSNGAAGGHNGTAGKKSTGKAAAGRKPTSKSAASKPTAGKSTASKPIASKKAGVVSPKTARAVGKQLGKTKGMFSDFMHEFEENSK